MIRDILQKSDMEVPRTAAELAQWIEEKQEALCVPGVREDARLRKGLARPFYEEIGPLSVLMTRLFDARDDVVCTPKIGNQAYDAIIWDRSVSPALEIPVEVTFAVDGHAESIRMEALNRNGRVDAVSRPRWSGTRKTGRTVYVPDMAHNRQDTLCQIATDITASLEKKSLKRYGRRYYLVVGFPDYMVYGEDSVEELEELVRCGSRSIRVDVARVFVVGASGRVFFQLAMK